MDSRYFRAYQRKNKENKFKAKTVKFTYPGPAIGLDIVVKRFNNGVKASVCAEYKSSIRSLQNQIASGH